MECIDKERVKHRFSRSLLSYRSAAEIQHEMAEALMDTLTLATGERQFQRVLELGCGTGLLTDLLEVRLDYAELVLLDLVPDCAEFHRHRSSCRFLAGDMENTPFPGSFDLIVSNAAIQWANDPKALFAKIAAGLSDGGVLAFTTFGPSNLQEIAKLTGQGLHYPAVKELQAQLETDFELLACQETLEVLTFSSAREVLKHQRATGVNAVAAPLGWNKSRLKRFEQEYTELFQLENGAFPLTYHPIVIIGQKKKRS